MLERVRLLIAGIIRIFTFNDDLPYPFSIWSPWQPELVDGQPCFVRSKTIRSKHSENMILDGEPAYHTWMECAPLSEFIGKDGKPLDRKEWEKLHINRRPYYFGKRIHTDWSKEYQQKLKDKDPDIIAIEKECRRVFGH